METHGEILVGKKKRGRRQKAIKAEYLQAGRENTAAAEIDKPSEYHKPAKVKEFFKMSQGGNGVAISTCQFKCGTA